MFNSRALLVEIAMLAVVGAACTSDTSLGQSGGSGGSAAGVGGITAQGGAIGSGAIPGGGGGPGSGGAVAIGTGGAITVGSGGTIVIGVGGSQAGGSPGTKDGGTPDLPIATDGGIECAPGYGVGSTRPAGDGCNTCSCQANGSFVCSAKPCAAPDAAGDPAICPAGQVWCPGCTPGTGSCGAACTAVACLADAGGSDVASDACSQLTTQAACDARSDCHSVFRDLGTCGCAAKGCCIHFSACADGGKALCTMPSTMACTIATPSCESPYVVSYTKACYEGCVLESECEGAVSSDASVGTDTGGTTRDAGSSCPIAEPQAGAACEVQGLQCEYGAGACCGHGYSCNGGTWQKLMLGCACAAPLPDAGSLCTTDSDCPGQVCVTYVTHAGPTTSIKGECRANPCNNVTASCGCGSSLCTAAGFPLCSVSGTQLTCDDGRQ